MEEKGTVWMINSDIRLSSLIAKSKIVKEKPIIINEQPFHFFARATSKLFDSKCLFVGEEKYARLIDEYTRMVITNQQTYKVLKDKNVGFCVTEHPQNLFFQLMNEYERDIGIKQNETVYGKDCKVAQYVSIAKQGVKIGNNVVIEDFVQIGSNVIIGDNTVICSGAKIGVQGFNVYEYQGERKQLFHNGVTNIGENVLIGPNTIIQQALYHYGETIVGQNAKIDGNVVIGHNATIGQGCEITAGSCIAGYVEIGDGSIVRLNSTIRNGLKIGCNAHIGMGSVVVYRVRDNARIFGNPAKDMKR